jgi:DNA invertase Pin-like site-specific DNA recombinase
VTATAGRLGLALRDIWVDAGVSGALSIADRPVLLAAVGALRRGDVFLIAKRDRLGRDVIAVAMIERLIAKRGARVVSAAGEGTDNEDPSSLLMRRLIDSFAEYERLIIGARTKSALAAKRRRGECVGGVPFGSRLAADGVQLEPDTREQGLLARMQVLRTAGLTLRGIASLNAAGLRTRRGTAWRFQHVATADGTLNKSVRRCPPEFTPSGSL